MTMGVTIVTLFLCLLPALVQSELLIINQPMVATPVYEKEGTEFRLQCITCSGGAPPYSVTRVGVSPSFAICSGCFEVYDEINNRPEGDFCLYYLPSQGGLSYRLQRTYNVSVQCLDSSNNVSDYAIIDVRVRTNEPPFFNNQGGFRGTCGLSRTMTAGAEVSIPEFAPFDPDNDPITYTMTSDPPNDFFSIHPASGRIRATKDLTSFCHKSVSFNITATDTDGNRIGPFVATCEMNDAHVPPTISNVNKEISISEDAPIGTTLVEPYLRTTPMSPFVTYDISTFPTSALSSIEIQPRSGAYRLLLKEKLNFESPNTQNFNISIRPQNGFCDAVEHFIYVRTTDANDSPILTRRNETRTVPEGGVLINPEWNLIEEDSGDIDVFSIIGGNEEGLWSIDPSSGIISSSSEIDIDSNIMERNWTLLVEVEDRSGGRDNASIVIVVEDINDHAPIFTQSVYTTIFMDCDSPRNLGQVLSATDEDSAFRGNNVVNFVPVTSNGIRIFPDGTVLVETVPPVGTSASVSTNAVDNGEVPGPLTSTHAGTIVITTIPCTTTVPTTAVVVVNNTNNNNSTTNSSSNSNSNANANANAFAGLTSLITGASGSNAAGTGIGDIFLWVLAGLLGLLLLAALTYLIWRYCAKFCTGSSTWSDGCGCNRAKTPRHIRPFSQDRAVSRQKEDFKSAKKEIEEEEEEEIVEAAPAAAPVVYGNTIVPQTKVNRYLRVRQLVGVPVKPQQVKVKSYVPIPPNQPQYQAASYPNATNRPVPNGPPPPGPPNNLASYKPAPTGP